MAQRAYTKRRHRGADCRSQGTPQFALSAGRLAGKNDPIDAEMIACFAETFSQAPGQLPDAAREELAAIAKARKVSWTSRSDCKAQNEHTAPEPVQGRSNT